LNRDKLKSGLIFISLVVLGTIAAVSLYFFKATGMAAFLPGVSIGGVPVGGLNLEQARVLLGRNIDEVFASHVTFYKDDYTYTCSLGELCLPLDAAQIAAEVWEKEQNKAFTAKLASLKGPKASRYNVAIPYDDKVMQELEKEWEKRWYLPYRNARLEMDPSQGLITIPGQTGISVDAESTFKALPREMGKIADIRVPILTREVKPQVEASDLAHMGELASYSTNFNAADINRSHNLYTAAASINGSLVEPGEVFSFNRKVGMRSLENGFRDAMVIVGGKFEPGLGGGICQVSSTLYNSCLLAGLKIVERHNHNLAVAYVPLGRDATVTYGVLDFRFQNDTDSPIYIRAVAGKGVLTVKIYGNLAYKRKIEVYNLIDKTIPFKTVTEIDPQLKSGEEKVDHNGQPGYVVRTYRVFYDAANNKIKTERLSQDNYLVLDKLVKQGPPAVPPVTAPENPDVSVPPANGSDQPAPPSGTPDTTDTPNQPPVPGTDIPSQVVPPGPNPQL